MPQVRALSPRPFFLKWVKFSVFESTGVVDKKFYDKYTWTLSWKTKRIMAIAWLICSVVFSLFVGTTEFAIFISTILLIYFLIASFVMVWFSKRKILQRLKVLTGESKQIFVVDFEEDCVVVKEQVGNSITKIQYENIVKLKKRDSVYFLFTKADMFIPVFVENFSEEEKKAFLEFLKAHLPKVKKF